MNIFNKKTILFFSITTLIINGCVAKNEFKTKSETRVLVAEKQYAPLEKLASKRVSSWKFKKNTTKKEDCIDCYATPIDYSKPPSRKSFLAKVIKPVVKPSFYENKLIATKRFGAYDYKETLADTTVKINRNKINTNSYAKKNIAPSFITPAVSYVNSSYGSYSLNTAIQVGAFREYKGAISYKKRYAALSNKYTVSIRSSRKNNKPLHRVRIEGFKNKNEAKMFMNTYGIQDAFLVIK